MGRRDGGVAGVPHSGLKVTEWKHSCHLGKRLPFLPSFTLIPCLIPIPRFLFSFLFLLFVFLYSFLVSWSFFFPLISPPSSLFFLCICFSLSGSLFYFVFVFYCVFLTHSPPPLIFFTYFLRFHIFAAFFMTSKKQKQQQEP